MRANDTVMLDGKPVQVGLSRENSSYISVLDRAGSRGLSTTRAELNKLLGSLGNPQYDAYAERAAVIEAELRADRIPTVSERLDRLLAGATVWPTSFLTPGSRPSEYPATERTQHGTSSSERPHIDETRITLMEDLYQSLQATYGAENCRIVTGANPDDKMQARDGSFVAKKFVMFIVEVNSEDGSTMVQHAVAINPVARKHATYVVRGDISTESWDKVLSGGVTEARELGARRVLYNSEADIELLPAMLAKLMLLLRCSSKEFRLGDFYVNAAGEYRLTTRIKNLGRLALDPVVSLNA